ncbi:hypothetical protein RF11_14344 [Thelohanellus kitauei]|uniref:Uncharacterized protein n=1 Tax=Thelohanellus kitauei TaxID=669202 RepID=A0A0C2MK86_THEKT|nr:hypothetical protein RF11_14344 [Thelohanellus kitauei]
MPKYVINGIKDLSEIIPNTITSRKYHTNDVSVYLSVGELEQPFTEFHFTLINTQGRKSRELFDQYLVANCYFCFTNERPNDIVVQLSVGEREQPFTKFRFILNNTQTIISSVDRSIFDG